MVEGIAIGFLAGVAFCCVQIFLAKQLSREIADALTALWEKTKRKEPS